MRRGAVAALLQLALAAALLGWHPAWAQQEVKLAGSTVRFATLEEAQAELSRDDAWVQATSEFQRSATLGTQDPVTREELRGALTRSALEWAAADRQRWQAALELLAPRLEALGVRLPERILLVSTDGKDAANAPYTRGTAVFLPRTLTLRAYSDMELLAHEFFHVMTRQDPALANRIYALFGFEPVEPLEWPAAWEKARIANPDAPHHRHAMRIAWAGDHVQVMPLLVARKTQLAPGETFFSVMDVRLLSVEPGTAGQPTRAVLRNGEPVWMHAQYAPPYMQRLGGNTAYVFHPEETAADNFAFLASGRPVPNPQLLRALARVLAPSSEKEESKP